MIKLSNLLQESKATIGGNSYVVVGSVSKDGITLSFTPSQIGLGKSKAERAKEIYSALQSSMPKLAQALRYDSQSPAAGVTFVVEPLKLAEVISQSL